VPLLFFFRTIRLPALLLLGYWFLMQFFSGFQMQAIESATAGGVAWWAHVGGFAVGLLMALTLRTRRRNPAIQVLS
jgi:membrane associated rhomboid family serine protease